MDRLVNFRLCIFYHKNTTKFLFRGILMFLFLYFPSKECALKKFFFLFSLFKTNRNSFLSHLKSCISTTFSDTWFEGMWRYSWDCSRNVLLFCGTWQVLSCLHWYHGTEFTHYIRGFNLKQISAMSEENEHLLNSYYLWHTVVGTLKKLFSPHYNSVKYS